MKHGSVVRSTFSRVVVGLSITPLVSPRRSHEYLVTDAPLYSVRDLVEVRIVPCLVAPSLSVQLPCVCSLGRTMCVSTQLSVSIRHVVY